MTTKRPLEAEEFKPRIRALNPSTYMVHQSAGFGPYDAVNLNITTDRFFAEPGSLDEADAKKAVSALRNRSIRCAAQHHEEVAELAKTVAAVDQHFKAHIVTDEGRLRPNIPEDYATQATDAVYGFLKGETPETMRGDNLENVIKGTNLAALADALKTFSEKKPLSETQFSALSNATQTLNDATAIINNALEFSIAPTPFTQINPQLEQASDTIKNRIEPAFLALPGASEHEKFHSFIHFPNPDDEVNIARAMSSGIHVGGNEPEQAIAGPASRRVVQSRNAASAPENAR